jgi:4-aminobutyrate aminotransferase-like enzyme/Ser/Thr protein kinase RdoA (MazF antagonist)
VEMKPTVEGRPCFSSETVRKLVQELYGLDGRLEPLPAEWDQNLRLDAGNAGTFVVKIANRGHSTGVLEFQNAAMNRLSRLWASGKSPRVVPSLSGHEINLVPNLDGAEYRMRLLTYLDGRPFATVQPRDERTLERLGNALGDLDRCLADVQHPSMDRQLQWDLRHCEWISPFTHRISDLQRRRIVETLLLQYRARVAPLLSGLPVSVIHNDANDENILLAADPAGGWKLVGLLDFGDMVRSYTVNELAIACAYASLGAEEPLTVAAKIAAGYHQSRPLAETEVQALFPLMCMRLCVSVTISAIAAEEDPQNKHRQISDKAAWEALERFHAIDWRDAEDQFRSACGFERQMVRDSSAEKRSYETLLQERSSRIGPSLSLSYKAPLEIVRGSGQFLFEPSGRGYLDCVNNVCHVGHSHPRVVAALSSQAAALNTNTRYLNRNMVEYARRLTATLPEPLRVCYFVNSGSEANELAVRLARTHTGRHDAIVLEDAYHGNTQTLVDLSPYKCEGPGGRGLATWAHKVPKPDPYRGLYRGTEESVGRAYADHVRQVCDRLVAEGRPPALFLCESMLSCGGQIVLPPGYLREAFRYIRAAGGLCAVDEVQVGLGRAGSHMWAFQTQDVIPDIVTLGKPIGNGHPLGAVITTPEIARSFANGMEFFSTFGGNPVSMAVGMAVLDVIEEEHLLERAERVGRYLTKGFRTLAERHPEIGDVRGLGLFIGVELVRDRETRAPATEKTALLVERAKADGILLSAEGPHHNVLKIKPPLQFLETDADLLLGAVDRALYDLRGVARASGGTPFV